VGGYVNVERNGALTVLGLSALESVGDYLYLNGNGDLEDVNLTPSKTLKTSAQEGVANTKLLPKGTTGLDNLKFIGSWMAMGNTTHYVQQYGKRFEWKARKITWW